MASERKFAKLKVGRLYSLPSGDVVRVVRIDQMRGNVIVHNYHSHHNEVVEYVMAPSILTPVLKIGEIAKLFGKKTTTIRKYEEIGLIPKVRKVCLNSEGKITTRLYTPKDVEDLIEFFDRRKPVGRPASTNRSGLYKENIRRKLDSRYEG
jgi:hypothetical protein